jgi:hypothetical protein
MCMLVQSNIAPLNIPRAMLVDDSCSFGACIRLGALSKILGALVSRSYLPSTLYCISRKRTSLQRLHPLIHEPAFEQVDCTRVP